MGLHIGGIAPDFRAESPSGTIRCQGWLGHSGAILFSLPNDDAPVCPTALRCPAHKRDGFARLETDGERRALISFRQPVRGQA